jgi:hypothetical protein
MSEQHIRYGRMQQSGIPIMQTNEYLITRPAWSYDKHTSSHDKRFWSYDMPISTYTSLGPQGGLIHGAGACVYV